MWSRAIGAAAALAMGISAAGAQGIAVEGQSSALAGASTALAGASLDLAFSTVDLAAGAPLELAFRIDNLGGQVQTLQVRETATETRIELPADILFDFDKADIRPAAETALKQAAEVIRKGARGTVRVEGHTDGKGAPAYNQKLSERRAAAVQKWLATREGLRMKFATKGFGASKRVAPNARPDGSDDAEGRQKNRRVEIVFGRS
jgi:outer membrane protein OmpA-like peptidoglycan-associated protein